MKQIACALLFLTSLGILMTGCSTTAVNGADTAAGSASQEQRGVSDASITAAIKDAFRQDDLLNSQNIEVDTQEGVVRLAARLDSGRAANRAVSLAREITGVRRVIWSQLELTP